jgi:Sec-independent protein translocase protein TatA
MSGTIAPTRCYDPRMALSDIAIILIIILIAVVIWRGPKTLPLLGRAFGQSVRGAREEIKGMKDDAAKPKDPTDPADPSS